MEFTINLNCCENPRHMFAGHNLGFEFFPKIVKQVLAFVFWIGNIIFFVLLETSSVVFLVPTSLSSVPASTSLLSDLINDTVKLVSWLFFELSSLDSSPRCLFLHYLRVSASCVRPYALGYASFFCYLTIIPKEP